LRRWFWPYAILAVVLTVAGGMGAGMMLSGGGVDRIGGQIAVANATVVEPVMRFLVSTLEMVAPFDVPAWFKDLYAVLVMVVIGGLLLSAVLGLLLLPVFYALYRSTR
jgi:integral membrane sensor domain MASE1